MSHIRNKPAKLMRLDFLILIITLIFLTLDANAQVSSFQKGSVIKEFGKYATVEGVDFNKNALFKIAFDVGKQAEKGKVNRQFDSLARFINMHVAHGVALEHIQLALVVHGRASLDLLDDLTYQKAMSVENANKPLLLALMEHNVQVYLCGQTAQAYEISESQLVSGVNVSLSAMTVHALLQQRGFTSNPF